MLVIMAVEAEQHPVATVIGIVVIVVIDVMNGKLTQALPLELTPAARTHMRKQLERTHAITGLTNMLITAELTQETRFAFDFGLSGLLHVGIMRRLGGVCKRVIRVRILRCAPNRGIRGQGSGVRGGWKT